MSIQTHGVSRDRFNPKIDVDPTKTDLDPLGLRHPFNKLVPIESDDYVDVDDEEIPKSELLDDKLSEDEKVLQEVMSLEEGLVSEQPKLKRSEPVAPSIFAEISLQDRIQAISRLRRNGILRLDKLHVAHITRVTKLIINRNNTVDKALKGLKILLVVAGVALAVVATKGGAIGLVAVPFIIPHVVAPTIKLTKNAVGAFIEARERYKEEQLKVALDQCREMEEKAGVKFKSEQDAIEYQRFKLLAEERIRDMGEMEQSLLDKLKKLLEKFSAVKTSDKENKEENLLKNFAYDVFDMGKLVDGLCNAVT